MTSIPKSIYIGLGGAGVKAIAYTKKMFEDTFGANIPPQVEFIALDFDVATDFTLPTDLDSNYVKIPICSDVRAYYEACRENGLYSWMPQENENRIPRVNDKGACSVRTNGRLFMEMSIDSFKFALQMAYNKVSSLYPMSLDSGFSRNSPVDVYIVTSLAGGTGSGSFLTVAHLVKTLFGSCANVIGYGLMGGIYRIIDPVVICTHEVLKNAYAALLELDYYQSASLNNPVSFEVAGRQTFISEPLFDEFYLIDSNTESGYIIDNINVLCESIGTAIFNFSCCLGDAGKAVLDHYSWKCGLYNFANKIGWVQRLGVCQVVYNGERVSRAYSLMVKKALLELNETCSQGNVEIDSAIQKWLLDSGLNNVDALFEKLLSNYAIHDIKPPVSYEGSRASKKDADILMSYFKDFKRPDYNVEALSTEITNVLRIIIDGIIKKRPGTACLRLALSELLHTFRGYIVEIEEEEKALADVISSVQSDLDGIYTEFCNTSPLFIMLGRGRLYMDALSDAGVKLVGLKMKLWRSEAAAEFMKNMIDNVEKLIVDLDYLSRRLHSLLKSYELELSDLSRDYSGPFELDISHWKISSEIINSSPDIVDAVKEEWLSSVATSVIDLSQEEIDDCLERVISNLSLFHDYRNMSIDALIASMPDKEYINLIHNIIARVSPLLRLNDRGLTSNINGLMLRDLAIDHCFVSLYAGGDAARSRIEQELNLRNTEFIYTDNPTFRQRMIFHRIDMSYIPYLVDVPKSEYDNAIQHDDAYNPHIDLHIYEDMKRKDFKLRP